MKIAIGQPSDEARELRRSPEHGTAVLASPRDDSRDGPFQTL
jgi:hypothetical protein